MSLLLFGELFFVAFIIIVIITQVSVPGLRGRPFFPAFRWDRIRELERDRNRLLVQREELLLERQKLIDELVNKGFREHTHKVYEQENV